MTIAFDPSNWFWIVGKKYWSSALAAYVPTIPEDVVPTRINSEQELSDVLRVYGLRGPVASSEDVVKERARRLAAGFYYDFKDSRGRHYIGTTEADLQGWSEVTSWMNTQNALGLPDSTLNIWTDTGVVAIKPLDWAKILNEANAFRQPIWSASFVLQEKKPIPADYYDDKWWV